MKSIQELFQFILKQERTIVFGNLGRKRNILFEALQSLTALDVIVISEHYPFPASDLRIRVLHPKDPIHRCDLIVYIEPPTLKHVEKHPMASHAVIFTSHFTFKTQSRWTYVCYFHALNDLARRTREMLEKQDPSVQTRNVDQLQDVNVLIIKNYPAPAPIAPNTNVILDLTQTTQDVLPMYLHFWDGFDYLLENSSLIYKWIVCFPEPGGLKAFQRFTQTCIDILFCKKIEHGNVTRVQDILALVPFYKSGTLDRNYKVRTLSFGGIPYVAPRTLEEACQAAAQFDTLPIAKNVLLIK